MLTPTELAVWKLSLQSMTDRQIASTIGISREWACICRNRAEKKVQILNRFAIAQGQRIDSPENIPRMVEEFRVSGIKPISNPSEVSCQ